MRLPAILVVAMFVALAGCSAKGGSDPFAYTRKDLVHTTFDLALAQDKVDEQDFRVEDGSIVSIRLQVWVNATAGQGSVDVIAPSGRTVLSTASSTTVVVPVDLGVWRVLVKGSPDAAGEAAIVAVRAGSASGGG